MILFCFVLLFHDFSKCQTIFSQRTVDDIGNPLIDLDKCGRKGMRSHVCDPDGLITVEQAFQLDDQIRAIYNETPCHCSLSVCGKSGGWGGYMVGLAMIKKMRLQIGTEMLAFRSDSNDLYDNAVLSEARYFSGALLSTWNMGRCNEDLLIFYSMEDNMLYVSTNVKTRTLMSDEFVRDVSRDVAFKLELRDKESIAEGFKTMLSLFKSALQGNKPTTTPLRLGASQVFYDHDNSFYGNYYQGNAQQLEGRSSNSATANGKSGLVVGCSLFAYPLLLLLLVLSMY